VKIKKISINILLFLGVFVICFGLIEVTMRIIHPEWAPTRADRLFWEHDALLGWKHKPYQIGSFHHFDFSVTVSNNSQGLRDKEYSIARTEKKRLLILGDSFGWGFGVEVSQRFSELMEARHQDWEIINASVSGYSTGQQLLYLKNFGIDYRPDVILLLFSQNDFEENFRLRRYWQNSPKLTVENGQLVYPKGKVPKPSMKQKFEKLVFGRTYFFARLYKMINRYFKPQRLGGKRVSKDERLSHMKKAGPLMGALLLELNSVASDHDSKLVVISIPMSDYRKKMLREMLESLDIPYLPLDKAFMNSEQRTTFKHDAHWNQEGHKVAADAIEKFFNRLGIFSLTKK